MSNKSRYDEDFSEKWVNWDSVSEYGPERTWLLALYRKDRKSALEKVLSDAEHPRNWLTPGYAIFSVRYLGTDLVQMYGNCEFLSREKLKDRAYEIDGFYQKRLGIYFTDVLNDPKTFEGVPNTEGKIRKKSS